MIKDTPEILINFEKQTDGEGDRAITTTAEQGSGFECMKYAGGYIQGYMYNWGNADNFARVYCKPCALDYTEYPYFHGAGGNDTLFPADYEIHSMDVAAGSTTTAKVPFMLVIPEINSQFWKWYIEIEGTDKTVNGILQFFPIAA